MSCDDISAEPKAVPTFTEISPKGGEVTAKIIRRDGGKLTTNWAFERIYTTYNQGDDQTETAVLIDTLADGRVKYAGEWYTFYVSKDKREIKLVLAANKTKVQRSVIFLGIDTKPAFPWTLISGLIRSRTQQLRTDAGFFSSHSK